MKNRSYKVKICQIMLKICQVALKICKNTSFLPKFSHMYQFSDIPPPPPPPRDRDTRYGVAWTHGVFACR